MTTQQEKEIAELIAEKDAIEKELAELAVWFEHSKFGLHGNFTDREGFPDEDAAAIIETKTKRGRRAVLSTDHVRVMREIEERLFVRKPDVERTVPTSSPLLTEYVPQPLPSESRPPPPSLKPLARVE